MGAQVGEVTRILRELHKGNRKSEARLIELVYDELHRLARRYMRMERPDHTLQPSAVVNEAWLKLVGDRHRNWQNRSHFVAAAAQAMRLLLVAYGRRRNAAKRAGATLRLDIDLMDPLNDYRLEEMIAVDQALARLKQWDERQSRVVELRYFAGLTEDEVAAVLGVTPRTVKRDWTLAKAWLYGELRGCGQE
jgi:RNA polymerase sigma-70 factor, ECF subfamily